MSVLPPPGTPLCALDALGDPDARGFAFGEGTSLVRLFVVRKDGVLRGYVNSCPHAFTPLDWVPDRFFDREKQHLLCATHGALFRILDGVCVRGPCAGKALTPVPVEAAEGVVRIARTS